MAALDDDVRALFARPLPGWATTVRPDGSLHSTVVWVDVDDEGVYFNTAAGRVKERNLAHNPQVSVSVVDPDDIFHYASVSGLGKLQTEGADAVIDHLAKKYLGADSYPFRRPGEQRVTVRVDADRVMYSSGS
ncbi:MAG TPA: PPOX class F420-dependent oxidoreductase [Kineosporiaceae bacterium]|nr:PPOX class F420-dependent oxidoreductase [Kineosporiaceae bacterium]